MNHPKATHIVGKALLIACCGLLFFGSVGCETKPDKIYQQAVDAKEKKDLEKFLGCFTTESKRVIESLMVLSKKYPEPYLKDPFRILNKGTIVGEIQYEIKDDEKVKAYVTIKTKEGNETIKFLKEDDKWRINALELKGLWEFKKQ